MIKLSDARWPVPQRGRWIEPWVPVSVLNPSRIFDPTRRAVRFLGHDSAMEWSFFVTEGALKRLQPNVERSEASLLLAFDTHRAAIHAVAITTYKGERKGSYELVAADFSPRD
jgi:hypothetical protein